MLILPDRDAARASATPLDALPPQISVASGCQAVLISWGSILSGGAIPLAPPLAKLLPPLPTILSNLFIKVWRLALRVDRHVGLRRLLLTASLRRQIALRLYQVFEALGCVLLLRSHRRPLRLPIAPITLLLLVTILLAHTIALLLPVHRYLGYVNIIIINYRTIHVNVDVLEVIYNDLMVHGIDRRTVTSATATYARIGIVRVSFRGVGTLGLGLSGGDREVAVG